MATENAPASKKRKRRRIVVRLLFAFAVILGVPLAIYAVLAIRFYSQSPRLARNFAAELNAPLLEIPEEERAWPRYRAILLKRRDIPAEFWISEEYINSESQDEAMLRKLQELNGHLLDEVREASKIPRLGFLLRDEIDPADYAWHDTDGAERGRKPPPANENPSLLAIQLPHVSELREFARQLDADAIDAAMRGGGPLATDDVLAMLRIADQLRETSLLVTDIASWKILEKVFAVTWRLVDEFPESVADSDLRRLAVGLASISGGGRIRPRWSVDRLTCEDIAQRVYTDDGDGDGYLRVSSVQRVFLGTREEASWWSKLSDPIATLRYAKRAEAISWFNAYMDASERECQQPYWKWDPRESARIWRDIHASPRLRVVTLWLPKTRTAYSQAEALTQERDTLLVAIALELYRRAQGSWPRSLTELTPVYLPEIPPDLFDGAPLRYRIIDGQPLLYSVGADRDDDGGNGHFVAKLWVPGFDDAPPSDPPDGDWLLWPRPDGEVVPF